MMGDQEKLRKNLEALAALLVDIEKQLESESNSVKGRIRELHQQCLLELALLKSAENNGSE